MKKDIAKKWVRALRSKKYRQARGVLKTRTKAGTTSHCCLGVLCELYQQDQVKAKKKPMRVNDFSAREYGGDIPRTNRLFEFGDAVQTLPARVQRWAGIKDDVGTFRGNFTLYHGQQCLNSLAELNDNGARFSTIANVIEEHTARI